MPLEKPHEAVVNKWLETLGITLLCEWDVLIFLYRHNTSLVSAEQIARLLGYRKVAVGAALDVLEAESLIQRSRGSQGARMYGLSMPADPSRRRGFQELMSVVQTRPGRLLLVRSLRQLDRPKSSPAREGLHLA
jgi:hypothetical protein